MNHRVIWTPIAHDRRDIVGRIVDLGDVLHLHADGSRKQTYTIIVDKKRVQAPVKGNGHFIIRKNRIEKISEVKG